MSPSLQHGGICHLGPGKAGCGKPVRPLCDVGRQSTRILNQAAGTTFTINFALTACNYFQALALVMHAVDTVNPTTIRNAVWQQSAINGCRQEPGSQAALAVGALNFISLVRDFDVPDNCACPTGMGIFSRAELADSWTVGFENDDTAALDMVVTALGNCLSACPPGIDAGKPFVGGFT